MKIVVNGQAAREEKKMLPQELGQIIPYQKEIPSIPFCIVKGRQWGRLAYLQLSANKNIILGISEPLLEYMYP